MCLRPLNIGKGVSVPCGKCIECRLQYTNDWVLRVRNELKSHTKACFLTLTYNSENLPRKGSLSKPDFQKFMKRTRKHFKACAIRYFMCGEYGEKRNRPHYHVILFGVDFDDKYLFLTEKGYIYRSPTLERLWPFGFSSIGVEGVSEDSIKYCTKYLVPLDNKYYVGIQKPFVLSSRRPGIGFLSIPKSVFDDFSLYVDGRKVRAPYAYIRKVISNDIYLQEKWRFFNMSVAQKELFFCSHKLEIKNIDGIEFSEFKEAFPDFNFEYFNTYDISGNSQLNVICSEEDYNTKLYFDNLLNIISFEYYDKMKKVELRRKKYKDIFGNSIDKFFRPVYNNGKHT